MNTYVNNEVLPVGYEMKICDPNSGEEVTVRVTKSGWREKGGQCSCHPQWHQMFAAEVLEGFEPGRIVRGYTNTYDQENICAFILVNPNLDEITRDLRLAREGKAASDPRVNERLLTTLERVLVLRDQLQDIGWDADYLRNQLRPENGSLDLRFFESCGTKHHQSTGWMNGCCEVIHDGHLVMTPGATSRESSECGCVSFCVQNHTVAYHRGYPRVYVTAEATAGSVDEFLRAAFEDSPQEFQEQIRSATSAV